MTGGEKDLTNLWWETIARHFGLDPVKDVELLFSGASSARLAALLGGAIDASVLSPPQTFMALRKAADLARRRLLSANSRQSAHINEKWAQANAKILIAFAKANDEAVRYMLDPPHKAEVSEMLAKASGLTVDDAMKTWDQSIAENGIIAGRLGISAQALQMSRICWPPRGDLKTPARAGGRSMMIAFFARRRIGRPQTLPDLPLQPSILEKSATARVAARIWLSSLSRLARSGVLGIHRHLFEERIDMRPQLRHGAHGGGKIFRATAPVARLAARSPAPVPFPRLGVKLRVGRTGIFASVALLLDANDVGGALVAGEQILAVLGFEEFASASTRRTISKEIVLPSSAKTASTRSCRAPCSRSWTFEAVGKKDIIEYSIN